jgi:hypothetical protein
MLPACDWRICAAIRKDSIGMLCHIAPVMHTLGICAMVFGLAALLIVGFLNIVQDLLSRSVFEAPSRSSESFAIRLVQPAAEIPDVQLENRSDDHRSVA